MIKKYWEDPYLEESTCTVIKCLDEKRIIVTDNVFYPEGGGQESDVGWILDDEKQAVIGVIHVQRHDKNSVILETKKGIPHIRKGDILRCRIDLPRRKALTRAHTSQHLVSALFLQETRNNTKKAEIKPDKFRIELEKQVDYHAIKRITYMANTIILQEHPVRTRVLEKNEAQTMNLQTRSHMKKTKEETWRVVSIGEKNEIDSTFCGGTHVRNTKELGIIYPVSHGKKWVEFVTGMQGIEVLSSLSEQTLRLQHYLKTDYAGIAEFSMKRFRHEEQLEKDVTKLQLEQAKHALLATPIKEWGERKVRVVHVNVPGKVLPKILPTEIHEDYLIIFTLTTLVLVSHKQDLKAVEKELRDHGFRGGGSNTFAQYAYPKNMDTTAILKVLRSILY